LVGKRKKTLELVGEKCERKGKGEGGDARERREEI
jgi:hypothetical protein